MPSIPGLRICRAGGSLRCVLLITLFALYALRPTGDAAAQEDPGWPCMQRKVPHLFVAQLWAGPSLPEDRSWRDDPELARLVSVISARRTGLDEVRRRVAGIRRSGDKRRDERLLALFAGVFEVIDDERARVIAGIEGFARNQRRLAERIDAHDAETRAAEAAAAPDDHDALDRLEEMQDQLDWDIRIFQDRQRSLSYVCESPVILEKRAFAVAQIVQDELGRD
jgi:hypothetical protein